MNNHSIEETNSSKTEETQTQIQIREKVVAKDEELRKLEPANIHDLPLNPPAAIDSNFVAYFVPRLTPAHAAFKDEGGITSVDFNVRKSDRSGFKVTGKRKKADREGYIAIIMPKPADWLKIKSTLLSLEEYSRMREAC